MFWSISDGARANFTRLSSVTPTQHTRAQCHVDLTFLYEKNALSPFSVHIVFWLYLAWDLLFFIVFISICHMYIYVYGNTHIHTHIHIHSVSQVVLLLLSLFFWYVNFFTGGRKWFRANVIVTKAWIECYVVTFNDVRLFDYFRDQVINVNNVDNRTY